MARTSTAVRPRRAQVRLDWLAPDPALGERLALVFLTKDSQDTQQARHALDAALGSDGVWDIRCGLYRISLDGLVALRALANRWPWPGLQSALADLEARDPEFEHQQRQLRWRKLCFARWEQEEKARQARERQVRREEREQRERERAQRRDFAQRASWQMRGLSPEIATAFAELGLLPSASLGLVEAAYKWWVLRAHPDLADQRDEAERLRRTERMKVLNRSREILVKYFARRGHRKG